ncbi:hypothetical protein G6L97_26725 (plasmid) [Agrobacterium tumefaciens]|uniref:hypothetical protein n=1 Tax=Agrobacterium tumefaciens TaxID=358 RepID=UPI001573988C|nr:hypothetical protein [Agrobacterium tumefaciens]NSZ87590.1 hypothetical protein [Agrobacterium tumefaciens]WCA72916.1 hypothetical protein G6L97_26725 [Agrobacterium tumefaciens]
MKYAIDLYTGAIFRMTGNDGTDMVHQSATATKDRDGFWRFVSRIAHRAGMPNNPYLFVRMANVANTTGAANYVADDTSTLKLWLSM